MDAGVSREVAIKSNLEKGLPRCMWIVECLLQNHTLGGANAKIAIQE